MGYLFFDIESYVCPTNCDSGFNPYFPESKAIVISYNYYPGFNAPKKEQLKPPIFLKEWESSEKKILVDFYHTVKNLVNEETVKNEAGEEHTRLKFVGFNILKFDLPYLFGRMEQHKIDEIDRLFRYLFVKPIAIDLYYLTPLVSQKTKEYGQLWGISQKEVNKFFGIQVKDGRGDELSRFYDKKEYDKIMAYCTQEFTFEQLYDSMLMHILKKQKL